MSVFIDEVTVELKAGKGGNGKVAFRREAHVEFGGPFGGNGGNGGDIIFIGDSGKNTLVDLKYNRHIRGNAGVNGETKGCHGARSEEHTSELQSRENLVCRLLLEKKKNISEKHQNKQKGYSV